MKQDKSSETVTTTSEYEKNEPVQSNSENQFNDPFSATGVNESVVADAEEDEVKPDKQYEQSEPVESNSENQFNDPFSATGVNESIVDDAEKDEVKPDKTVKRVETVRTSNLNSRNQTSTITRIVYLLVGVLEVLLGFRLVMKLLGASTASGFVALIYDVTKVFIAPFTGIFEAVEAGFETSTLIAMIVYALVGWGIAKLVAISTNTSSANN